MQICKKLVLTVIASSLGFVAIPAAFAEDAMPAAAAVVAAPAAEAKSNYVKPNMKHESYGTLKVVVPYFG
jgi:hypothetical protein